MLFQQITLIDYHRPLSARRASRKVCGPYSWRPSAPMTGRGFYQSAAGLACDRAGAGFALRLDWANDVLPRGSRLAFTSGYYCDEFGDGDTLKPIIARLPHGRGFLAGWTMGEGMCASLGSTIWEDAEDAARAAHDMAERDAEASAAENARQMEDAESEWLADTVGAYPGLDVRAAGVALAA